MDIYEALVVDRAGGKDWYDPITRITTHTELHSYDLNAEDVKAIAVNKKPTTEKE